MSHRLSPSNVNWSILKSVSTKPPSRVQAGGSYQLGADVVVGDVDDGALPSKPEKWNHYTLGKGDASHYAFGRRARRDGRTDQTSL